MRYRKYEVGIGIFFAIVISLFVLSKTDLGVTGYAVYGDLNPEERTEVIVQGVGFTAYIDGVKHEYTFTKNNVWYESTKTFEWYRNEEMGNSVWSGLYYLQGKDAKIIYKDTVVDDITHFASMWK